VRPRADLDGCEISRPTGFRSPGRPTRSESPYRPELSRPMYCVLHVSNISFITKGFLMFVLSFSKTFSYVTEQHLLVSCCRFVVPTRVVFMCMAALALLRDCPSFVLQCSNKRVRNISKNARKRLTMNQTNNLKCFGCAARPRQ
jgi:hypothetical protein